MAVIITFANQKGGSGKTTIEGLVGKSLVKDYKKKVLIIDADLQFSLSKLYNTQLRFFGKENIYYNVIQSGIINAKDTLLNNFDGYDVIMIDLPGTLYSTEGEEEQLLKILKLTDILLIPFKAGYNDYTSSFEFYKITRQMAKYKKVNDHADMIVKAFVNCNKRNLENRDLISLIEENSIDCMETMIRDSVKYPRIYETNLAVSESPESSPGIRNEFRLFMKEIVEMIRTFEN